MIAIKTLAMDMITWCPTVHAICDALHEVLFNIFCFVGILSRPKPDPAIKLNGQTIVITGGNRGFGEHVTRDLVSRGAKVIIGCRDTDTALRLANELKNKQGSVIVKHLDLASFDSVKKFVNDISKEEIRIDSLVNNSGVILRDHSMTQDGHDMTIQVNYLSHVLLTSLLLNKLKQSEDPRIVFVSSLTHHMPVDVDIKKDSSSLSYLSRYTLSKVAMMMFCKRLAMILHPRIQVHTVDPGIGATDIFNDIRKSDKSKSRFFVRTAAEGANSILFPIFSKSNYNPTRFYSCDGSSKNPSRRIEDESKVEKIWKDTFDILAIPRIDKL